MGDAVARNGVDKLPAFAPFDFFARHKENEKEILRVYRTTATDVEAGDTITPAAEWLLDNHYIVEEAIQEVRRDFPRRFYRELPTMVVGGVEVPRTLVLAWLYVAHTHSTISQESLTALVDGFQASETLRIGELWALPSSCATCSWKTFAVFRAASKPAAACAAAPTRRPTNWCA